MSSSPNSAIAGDARYLLAQLFLPLREQRQQIERPSQSLRGGLMSGDQEGDDIVHDQPIGHRLAAGGIARADEPLQQFVALHLARPRFGKHAFSDAAHDFGVSRHRARSRVGNRRRQPKRGEHHLPDRIAQELRSRLLDEVSILLAEAGAEHGVLERLKRSPRHVQVDSLYCAWRGVAPAFEHRRAGGGESGDVRQHVLGSEQRRSVPPLPAPVIAFGIK